MNNGDIVFFKNAKESSANKSKEHKFKGHGFGVLLGHVPPFAKDPPADHLLRLMGTVGFISFDDVAEFLSVAQMEEIANKFQDKYYGKTMPVAPPVPNVMPQTSSLIDATGKPILAARGRLVTVGGTDLKKEPESEV